MQKIILIRLINFKMFLKNENQIAKKIDIGKNIKRIIKNFNILCDDYLE